MIVRAAFEWIGLYSGCNERKSGLDGARLSYLKTNFRAVSGQMVLGLDRVKFYNFAGSDI